VGGLVVLQLFSLFRLLRQERRAELIALSAVLALWGGYILVVEPVERQLYDSREFSLQVDATVAGNPAPLVLYSMGRDARAIKFMVNLDHDMQPLFAEQPAQLAAIQGPYYLMLDEKRATSLKAAYPALGAPVLAGNFDNDRYCLLHVTDAGVFGAAQ
jgi:hypothetical protein